MEFPMSANVVKSGISVALADGVPEIPHRHLERLPQGFNRPCFFVWQINQTHTKMLQNYYFRTHNLVIRCFLEEKGDFYFKLEQIAERLYCTLEYIFVENSREDKALIRGINMSHTIEEGVLQFYITYEYRCYVCLGDQVKMRILDLNENIVIKEKGVINYGRW